MCVFTSAVKYLTKFLLTITIKGKQPTFEKRAQVDLHALCLPCLGERSLDIEGPSNKS